jgi:hypothetical protein
MPSVTLEIGALVIALVERDAQIAVVEGERPVQVLDFEEDLFDTNEPHVLLPSVTIHDGILHDAPVTHRDPGTATIFRQPSILSEQLPALLLDHLVGAQQQRRRDREAERLGGFEIDDELELGRLLDGEIRRSRTLEDLVDV